jgi:two-component system, OmpR family, copper resistance phosphate regulon response regulator CusR
MSAILIVEDEPAIADFVDGGLRAQGHGTAVTDEAPRALALALSGDFDLIILDLGLPGGDGFDVLRAVRDRGQHVPILVLTGHFEQRDAVACLEAGADDYMTKPFRFEELLARVAALLRRPAIREERVLRAGDLELDLRTRRARLGADQVDLTPRELALLEAFLRHPDQVLSRQQLLSQVWGYFFDPGTNVVNVYVGSLRRKLGPAAIETVRGVGYRLRAVEAARPSEA